LPNPGELQRQGDVACDGPLLEEPVPRPEDADGVAGPTELSAAHRRQGLTGHPHRAFVGTFEQVDAAEEGPGSVGGLPDDAADLPRVEVEVNAVKENLLPVVMATGPADVVQLDHGGAFDTRGS